MDRVQKHEPISKDTVNYLRKLKVIEGKIPNIYISASLSKNIEEKAQYVKTKVLKTMLIKNGLLIILKHIKLGKRKTFWFY